MSSSFDITTGYELKTADEVLEALQNDHEVSDGAYELLQEAENRKS